LETTKLSSKGQVIIPKSIRSAHDWKIGQELVVVDMGDGILLKPQTPFSTSNIRDVASCLKYSGEAKSLREMEEAIKKGILESTDGSD